jgi:hypothetical protein
MWLSARYRGDTMTRITTVLLVPILTVLTPPEAFALITGGEGNQPITDPGWPAGAAAIFNHTGRVAWWEGPPFGGGQWHAECRCDTRALSAVLAEFARLDVQLKHHYFAHPHKGALPARREPGVAGLQTYVGRFGVHGTSSVCRKPGL